MAMTANDYRAQLISLLPMGAAFNVAPDSNMDKLLASMAEEFARFDFRIDDFLNEIDPRTTNEILGDWERAFGLPDPCTSLAQSTEERRKNLTRKIAAQGSQTKEFYVAVGAALGYTITVEDNIPFESGHAFNGQAITADQWVFVWKVSGPGSAIKVALCGQATCGDPIRWWGNALLECVINSLKPAHTHVIFSYTQ